MSEAYELGEHNGVMDASMLHVLAVGQVFMSDLHPPSMSDGGALAHTCQADESVASIMYGMFAADIHTTANDRPTMAYVANEIGAQIASHVRGEKCSLRTRPGGVAGVINEVVALLSEHDAGLVEQFREQIMTAFFRG